MTESIYFPNMKFQSTPQLGCINTFFFGNVNEIVKKKPGCLDKKDLGAISDLSKDKNSLNDLITASFHDEKYFNNFVQTNYKSISPVINKLIGNYKKDLWDENIEKTKVFSNAIQYELLSDDNFFEDVIDFYSYCKNDNDIVYIGLYPDYDFTSNSKSYFSNNKNMEQNSISVSYRIHDNFNRDLLSYCIHELGHFYFNKALYYGNAFSDVERMYDVIDDMESSLLYVNEAYSVTWQNMFLDYLRYSGKLCNCCQKSYETGTINHSDSNAVKNASKQEFDASVITIFSRLIKDSILEIGSTDRLEVTEKALFDLQKKIPCIKEQFSSKKANLR